MSPGAPAVTTSPGRACPFPLSAGCGTREGGRGPSRRGSTGHSGRRVEPWGVGDQPPNRRRRRSFAVGSG